MNLNVKFSEDSMAFDVDFGEIFCTKEYVGGEVYEGSYEVTPSVESQTLETKDRVLTDDITILEIPFFSVGNNSGGSTVYIGSEKEITMT